MAPVEIELEGVFGRRGLQRALERRLTPDEAGAVWDVILRPKGRGTDHYRVVTRHRMTGEERFQGYAWICWGRDGTGRPTRPLGWAVFQERFG